MQLIYTAEQVLRPCAPPSLSVHFVHLVFQT